MVLRTSSCLQWIQIFYPKFEDLQFFHTFGLYLHCRNLEKGSMSISIFAGLPFTITILAKLVCPLGYNSQLIIFLYYSSSYIVKEISHHYV